NFCRTSQGHELSVWLDYYQYGFFPKEKYPNVFSKMKVMSDARRVVASMQSVICFYL
ncbi:hypothetical protein TNIN_214371, partial [Trichonephila inaurata madagascariensis]